MALTLDDVKKIAALARLRLAPAEEEVFVGQLGRVVDYIDQLREYPGVEGAEAGASGLEAREAADTVHACLPREVVLANAPAALDGFVLVPEVKGGAEGA